MGHGDRHVLFHSTFGDPQSFGNFAVTEPVEFMHTQDTLSTCRQLGDAIGQPMHLAEFDQLLFRIWHRIRDFGRWRMGPILMCTPVALASLAPPRLAEPVENEIVRHSEEVAFRVGDRAEMALV